jgi:hypothetical protein
MMAKSDEQNWERVYEDTYRYDSTFSWVADDKTLDKVATATLPQGANKEAFKGRLSKAIRGEGVNPETRDSLDFAAKSVAVSLNRCKLYGLEPHKCFQPEW